MPRLTPLTYAATRTRLMMLWQDCPRVFSLVSAAEQYDLHRFFDFAGKQAPPPPDFHIAYRQRVTAEDPSLPQRAGRAIAKLEQRMAGVDIEAWRVTRQHEVRVRYAKVPVPAGGKRRVVVRSVMRPEPDIEKLGNALIAMAMQLAREETKTAKSDESSTAS